MYHYIIQWVIPENIHMHPHVGNWKLTPLPPSDVPIHLLLSETIFSPLPLRMAEISSVGGVWIFGPKEAIYIKN
jgi:hypothetical protein